MRIREMRWMGILVWPPQWSDSSHSINDTAVLRDIKFLVGTDLCRIDVDHNVIPHLGVMFVAKEFWESLYRKLKNSLGQRLAEIAELEVDLDQAESRCRTQAG